MNLSVNKVLDAKGLACPMPIVKTKKEMTTLEPGQVMEIQATDKGSTADLKAWAQSTGNQYLGTVVEGDTLKHYLRKASSEEEKSETKHPHTMNLDELLKKIEGNEKVTILDVREPAEYAFGHIPGAINIPLGEIEKRFGELNQNDEINIICRSGNRSDYAAQQLAEKGFPNVKNIVPGMKDWTGPTNQSNTLI
ncbi:MAG TPA: sulfurtransferase TusA family protein [Pseudoneobacillus sp.]|nr:sulfurtransferase TusA family protein [Pseudoneobacillus sp.]